MPYCCSDIDVGSSLIYFLTRPSHASQVPAHQRAKFVGTGGINLKRLTLETGVQLSARAEGEWTLFAPHAEAMAEARERIDALLKEEPIPGREDGADDIKK